MQQVVLMCLNIFEQVIIRKVGLDMLTRQHSIITVVVRSLCRQLLSIYDYFMLSVFRPQAALFIVSLIDRGKFF